MEQVQYVDQIVLMEREPNWGPVWLLISIGIFGATKQALSRVVPLKAISQGAVTVWKWINIANSLFHSLITGIGAVLCFYMYPFMAEDVLTTYSTLSHALLSFSSGYFVFDCFDMLVNHRKRSSFELMIHHAFVLSCFSVCVFTRYYLGFGMVALSVEVNSIFLHWRQLLLLTATPKNGGYYRGVSLINLVTFMIFRIVTLGWMTRWLVLNGDQVPFSVHMLGCVAMSGLVVMSIVLFFRLLRADFRSKSRDDKNQ